MAKKRTYTVEGISIKLSEDVVNDYRVQKGLFAVARPFEGKEGEGFERGYQASQMIEALLGTEEARIMTELKAKKDDGVVTFDDMLDWTVKLANKIAAQNEALKK